jgi:hypothetical protein
MEALTRFIGQRLRYKASRHWAGPRPLCRDSQLLRAITAHVGYPEDLSVEVRQALKQIDRGDAAHVMAIAAFAGIAYGRPKASAGQIAECRSALRDMDETAVFWTNGDWTNDNLSWRPLSKATFDCGVIGYDDRHAFIFWVEEED